MYLGRCPKCTNRIPNSVDLGQTGPGHAKMCLMPYANKKGADQPAHPCSLISTFVIHCLDSMICKLALSKVSRFQKVSVAEQAGLNLTWSKSQKTHFRVMTLRLILVYACLSQFLGSLCYIKFWGLHFFLPFAHFFPIISHKFKRKNIEGNDYVSYAY